MGYLPDLEGWDCVCVDDLTTLWKEGFLAISTLVKKIGFKCLLGSSQIEASLFFFHLRLGTFLGSSFEFQIALAPAATSITAGRVVVHSRWQLLYTVSTSMLVCACQARKM